MPHRWSVWNVTHRVWALWDSRNHHPIWIILIPGIWQSVTFSPESIWTIPFQGRGGDVRMPKLKQDRFKHLMACFVNVLGTFQGTWHWPNETQGALFTYAADIFCNIIAMRYSGEACWSPEKLVGKFWFDVKMNATIFAPAGYRSCVFCNQSLVIIMLQIPHPSLLVNLTVFKLRCVWHGRSAKRNWTYFEASF